VLGATSSFEQPANNSIIAAEKFNTFLMIKWFVV